MSRLCRQRQQQQQPRLRKAMQSALLIAWLAATVFIAEGQMDPTEMQRQIQQQMGGGSGGADGATSPNRIGELSAKQGVECAGYLRVKRLEPALSESRRFSR